MSSAWTTTTGPQAELGPAIQDQDDQLEGQGDKEAFPGSTAPVATAAGEQFFL